MSMIQSLILSLDTKIPQKLPQISNIFEKDLQLLSLALKKQKQENSYYVVLKYLVSEVKKKLNHKDYYKPLLQISLGQLQGKPYINQLKIKICEAIIQCQEFHRVNLVQSLTNQLSQNQILDPILRARLQIIYAGKQYLKDCYLKSSIYYLQASKQQAFIKQQQKKLQLINKSIAFCYISPINNQRHKHICSLCLNEIAKKSPLRKIVQKMYIQDIITDEDCLSLVDYFPENIKNSCKSQNKSQQINILLRSKFQHNMLIIMNSFSTISFSTLSSFLGMQIDLILNLLENTYKSNELKINQEDQFIYFNEEYKEKKQRVKQFFQKIDQIIQDQIKNH